MCQVTGAPDLYSFAVAVCDLDLFVEEEGAVGAHLLNMTCLFDTACAAISEPHRNQAQRWRVWRANVQLTLDNVCQFVS